MKMSNNARTFKYIDMDKNVKTEYDRWTNIIGRADPYVGRETIGIHEVLEAHFLLADFFMKTGEGIGDIGPRDVNLLHSALSRQFVQFGGTPKWRDRVDICATLMFGLVKNHPFHDANKRTAFLTCILHLQKAGKTPTATDVEYEDFTVAIADNKLDNYSFYSRFRRPSPDKEIDVMAHFLKRNTRNIDLSSKTVTYNVLNTILNSRGIKLDNPKRNKIDVIRYTDSDGTYLIKPKRIAHIGFHGWSRQVSQKDIEIVRETSRLDATHGYDSQAFFNGLEDPLTLIKKYREPLRRLAFR